MEQKKPDFVDEETLQEILVYLDNLRESGDINMFASPEYVIEEFDMGRHEARKVVQYWMNTFTERHSDGSE